MRERLISEELIGPDYAPKILRRTVELVDADAVADPDPARPPVPTISKQLRGPDYAPKMPVTYIDYPSSLEQ